MKSKNQFEKWRTKVAMSFADIYLTPSEISEDRRCALGSDYQFCPIHGDEQ